MFTRTRTREDGSTEYQHAIDTDIDAESYKLSNLIAEGNGGDRQMSVDDLQQRVGALEQRVAELEQLLDSVGIPTDDSDGDPDETDETHEANLQPHPKDVIAELSGAREDGVDLAFVLHRLRQAGFDDPDGEIDRLRRHGEIYEPSADLIKVV